MLFLCWNRRLFPGSQHGRIRLALGRGDCLRNSGFIFACVLCPYVVRRFRAYETNTDFWKHYRRQSRLRTRVSKTQPKPLTHGTSLTLTLWWKRIIFVCDDIEQWQVARRRRRKSGNGGQTDVRLSCRGKGKHGGRGKKSNYRVRSFPEKSYGEWTFLSRVT